MMTVSYAFNTWAPLLIYPTVGPYGAPRWRKGWPTALALFTRQWLLFVLAHVLHTREYVMPSSGLWRGKANKFISEKKRSLTEPPSDRTTDDISEEETSAGVVKEVFPKSS